MKIYDISQELFSCAVFPGNPKPERKTLKRMEDGENCNLSAFFMCAHNGTHVDAPLHFLREGKSIDQLPLESFVGPAWVAEHEGPILAEDAGRILREARERRPGTEERILVKGKAFLTEEGARVFAAGGIRLFGNESQTVGPEEAPMQVHLILLGAGVVLLEGIRLGAVEEGACFLHAAPLNLAGAEGAPCRATLIRE